VHAPHAPRSQPIFVPVSFSSSRSARTSVVRGSIFSARVTPFTFIEIATAPGPTTRGGAPARAFPESVIRPAAAAPPPVAPRNARRESPGAAAGAGASS
jgi:hypothetical protein